MPYLSPIVTLATLAALVHQIRLMVGRQSHERRTPLDVSVCAALVGLALISLADCTPAYLFIDRALGMPNTVGLLADIGVLLCAAAAQALFLYLLDPATAVKRTQVRFVLAGVVASVLTVMFVVGGFNREAPEDFFVRQAGNPTLPAYLLIYQVSAALAIADAVRLSFMFGRAATRRVLRVGGLLMAIGGVFGLMYNANITLATFAAWNGTELPFNPSVVGPLCSVIGTSIVGLGIALPAASYTLLDLRNRRLRRRQYRHLHPLWYALFQAMPDIALVAPRRPEHRGGILGAGTYRRLYRRIIEIHDGLYRLRPYLDPAIREAVHQRARAEGGDSAAASAAGEAAAIVAAIECLAAGEPAETAVTSGPSVTELDGDSDVAWLVSVSDALATAVSPPVIAAHFR